MGISSTPKWRSVEAVLFGLVTKGMPNERFVSIFLNISEKKNIFFEFWIPDFRILKIQYELIKLDKHHSVKSDRKSVCFYADNLTSCKRINKLSGSQQTFRYYFFAIISWNSLMILVWILIIQHPKASTRSHIVNL